MEQQNSIHSPWIPGFIVVGALTILYFGYQSCLNKIRKDKMGRSRSMSFNSSVMVNGAFPPTANVRSPIINCVFLFKNCPSREALNQSCLDLIQFNRFRSAVKLVNGEWTFDEVEVNVNNHVKTIEVTSETDVLAEADKIAEKEMTAADGNGNIPLWIFYRIINTGNGLSAVVIRIHHVIGDGIALVNAIGKVLKDSNGDNVIIQLPGTKLEEGNPDVNQQSSYIKIFKSLCSIVSLPASPYDSKTSFISSQQKKLVMTPKRSTVIFPTIRLDFLKAIKAKAQVTINDVMLAVVIGTIRRYCEKRKDPAILDGKSLLSRCLMPIAMPRSLNQLNTPETALRNYWVFLTVPLPMSIASIKERLAICNATTTELKSSPTAYVQMWLQNFLPKVLPVFLQRQTAYDIFTRHSMVFSNVPGPNTPIYLAGEKVEGLQVLFPNLIPQVMIVSYNGGVYFNMSLDDMEMPGALQEMPQLYLEEFTALAKEFSISTEEFGPMVCEESPGGVFGVSPSG